MCWFKEMRYKNSYYSLRAKKKNKEIINTPTKAWNFIDNELNEASNIYADLLTEDGSQAIYIDLIIKLQIARAYVGGQNQSVLTAKKILDYSQTLINMFNEAGSGLQVITDPKERLDAPVFPVDRLQQKLLLQQGLNQL
jgi:hypothetical protein